MERARFVPLAEPTPAIAEAFTRWENDPALVHLTRPNQSKADLETHQTVTADTLAQRLQHDRIYLIYLGTQLIGEMNYQVDPAHLLRKVPGTAWIGISIGEPVGRGKGIGYQALRYLEQEIVAHGLGRIELGVFEFNAPAIALYQKLGYQEIGRIPEFTYWQDRMWSDIRMEKQPSASS
jgi:RimJ/RimL family protein N-acetyltransferase